MKIVPIFDPSENLFAVHYDAYDTNELDRNIDLWNNISYLKAFYEENESYILRNPHFAISNIRSFIQLVSNNAEALDDIIANTDSDALFELFVVLQESESLTETISKRKAKHNFLRLYGIKVEDVYIITGGAIKLTQKMSDHPTTAHELTKLENFKEFLKEHEVFSEETLYELIIELDEN